jgi:prepilin-type N-terminal cleavage/methylation domain-containing protein
MKQNIRTKKGFTLVEAILVAILVGLLAAIGIIKAADAKAVVADNVIESAVQDVNMLVQRFAIDESNSTTATAIDGTDDAGTAWSIVLSEGAAAGYMTQTSAANLDALLDSTTGATAGKATDSTKSVNAAGTGANLEFYL